MPRPAVRVRDAVAEDLPVLVAFGEQVRDAAGGLRRPGVGRVPLVERYAEALRDPARRFVLAVTDDDVPLGVALFSTVATGALLDVPALHVTHVVVDERYRRRGAGHALVAAAAAHAEELGLEQVTLSVNPVARDANRFYARLGFAPLVVRRVAPLAQLRRRLGEHGGPVEQLVRRRALRR